MNEAIALLHLVRTTKNSSAEPVGIWYIDTSTVVPWYPAERDALRDRGWKALKGPAPSMLEWARYRASTSPSWRIVASSDLFTEVRPEELEGLYHTEHDAWAATVVQENNATAEMRSWEKHLDAHVGEQSQYSGWGTNRIVNAQSWWLASELVRRNPSLAAYETHPGDGMYDVLCVTTPETMSAEWSSPEHSQPITMLNRAGTVQIHLGQKVPMTFAWSEVLTAPDPHALIKRIETVAGWQPRLPAITAKRALAYRFMATLLTLTQNARIRWDVRMNYGSEAQAYPRGALDNFPGVFDAARTTTLTGAWAEPLSHFWTVRRGDEVVAVVSDSAGFFPRHGKPCSLMDQYVAGKRRIEPMVLELLGKLM